MCDTQVQVISAIYICGISFPFCHKMSKPLKAVHYQKCKIYLAFSTSSSVFKRGLNPIRALGRGKYVCGGQLNSCWTVVWSALVIHSNTSSSSSHFGQLMATDGPDKRPGAMGDTVNEVGVAYLGSNTLDSSRTFRQAVSRLTRPAGTLRYKQEASGAI